MLDQKTIDIVKNTVPILQAKGIEITTHFYTIMFQNNPEVKTLFDMSKQESGAQPMALAMTVLAAAQNIDRLETLLPAVQKIGARHVEVNVKPEHYPIVGKNLLQAFQDVLGEDATPEILEAWEKAYAVIADIFINVEKEIYASK